MPSKMKCDFTTIRLVPSLHGLIREVVTKWQNRDRGWSKSRLINPILKRGLKDWNKLSDEEVAELFDEYDGMFKKEVKNEK